MTENSPLDDQIIIPLKESLGDIFDELKNAFIEDGSELVTNATQSSDDNNYPELASNIHTLKSSARNIGANTLADHCVMIEKYLEAETYDEIPNVIGNIQQEMSAVTEALQTI